MNPTFQPHPQQFFTTPLSFHSIYTAHVWIPSAPKQALHILVLVHVMDDNATTYPWKALLQSPRTQTLAASEFSHDIFHNILHTSFLEPAKSNITHSYISMTSFITITAIGSFPYTICWDIINCLTSKL